LITFIPSRPQAKPGTKDEREGEETERSLIIGIGEKLRIKEQ
jgi:hypothetical protein